MTRRRLAVFATHPVQYMSPLYREIAKVCDLDVYYSFEPNPEDRVTAGAGVAFSWDVPLLDGYQHHFIGNEARRPRLGKFWGAKSRSVDEVLEANSFDAVLVPGWHSQFLCQAIMAARRRRIPLLVRGDSHLHGSRLRLLKQYVKYPAYRFLLNVFSAYLVVGERAREYLRFFGAPEDLMFRSPHAVDNDWWALRSGQVNKLTARADWNIPANSVVALFVGRLVGVKRPHDFVEALAQLSGRPIEGLMVGDGPLRASVEEYARARRANVRFAGFLNQTELPKAYAAADVLVLPSGRETWGLVANEAMACGLPVIASDACGCAPDLVDPSTGITFRTGDAADLARSLAAVADELLRGHEFAPAVKNRILAYSLANAAAGVLDAIEECL
jgi:glycosyltransferase involved in cell wall biosynthesis